MNPPNEPQPNDTALHEAQRIARNAAALPPPRPQRFELRRHLRTWHIVVINLIALGLFLLALKMHQN